MCLILLLINVTLSLAGQLLNDRKISDLNALLAHHGWHEYLPNHGIREIVNDVVIHYNISDILAHIPEINQIVNENNLNQKTRNVYQFLSCRYSRSITVFTDYIINYGKQCSRVDESYKSVDCLESLINLLNNGNRMMSEIYDSLLYLRQLSSAISFEIPDVFEVIEPLKNYTANKTFDKEQFIREFEFRIDVVNVQVDVISKELMEYHNSVRKFYYQYCLPISFDELQNGIFYPTYLGRRLNSFSVRNEMDADEIMLLIKTEYTEYLNKFSTDYDSLGFPNN